MDIKPVFNHYRAITYICTYLSKTEDECSHAMSQALKESADANFSNYEQITLIAYTYTSKRKCSIKEANYHILPELWLEKTFLAVLFGKTKSPQDRYHKRDRIGRTARRFYRYF